MGEVFAEAYRLRLMRGLEESLHDLGYGRIAGVDEAGRGCLAGPVVAAAVVVEGGKLVPGVDDSKAVDARRRELLATSIREAHPAAAVVAIGPREIDRINILEATRLAMVRALERTHPRAEIALVDAVRLDAPMTTLSVIRGDQISYAIACASILAKVERDRLMVELDRAHPQYGFASNKGYGSAAHRLALEQFGPCEHHRLTFRSVVPKESEQKTAARSPKVARLARTGVRAGGPRGAGAEGLGGRGPWL